MDLFDSGYDYEVFMGRWSRLVAREFVERLGVPPGLGWLDLGCGTGALAETILDHAMPTKVAAGIHLRRSSRLPGPGLARGPTFVWPRVKTFRSPTTL
jgi:hypothetical protein